MVAPTVILIGYLAIWWAELSLLQVVSPATIPAVTGFRATFLTFGLPFVTTDGI